ncbi:MAG: WG repeat-containing protein [Clostridia bacterium]|nr:WG repeat-containing protein [Clostridia bacterium]
MTLIDENDVIFEQEKKRKLVKIILIAIIILVIFCVCLLIFRSVAKKSSFKCSIDGTNRTDISNDILLKDEKGNILVQNGNIYVSIRKLSNILNYQFYNSEYKIKGEDKTKCQVKVNNIYTSYVAGSNKVYKAIAQENSQDDNDDSNNGEFEEIEDLKKTEFEYFTIADNIRYENEELYGSLEAIRLGFDITISYDVKNNMLTISTLDHLEKTAKEKRVDVVDSSEYSYRNKRLLKYGMVVVKDADGNLGVGSYTDSNKIGSFVASCKYSELEFNEGTKVISSVTSSDNKSGILYINVDSQEVERNVTLPYEEINEATNKFDYFVVKNKEKKYGIVNAEGHVIIPIQFEEIGIKEEDYSDITCKYILNDKYVPVKLNGKWGLYNIDGNKIIEPQFADVGCSLAQSGDSAVIIPNLKDGKTGIVFLYNKEKSFYGVYNADNGEKIAISLTEVYRKVENDQENFYINHIIDRATSKVHTLNLRTDL